MMVGFHADPPKINQQMSIQNDSVLSKTSYNSKNLNKIPVQKSRSKSQHPPKIIKSSKNSNNSKISKNESTISFPKIIKHTKQNKNCILSCFGNIMREAQKLNL